MKERVLTLLLVLSLLFNGAGVVFLCCWLSSQGKLKELKRAHNTLESDLRALKERQSEQTQASALAPMQPFVRSSFISHFDSMHDTFALAPVNVPESVKSVTLFVYLHGMGIDYTEPFVTPSPFSFSDCILAGHPAAVLLSSNYRKTEAWVRDSALADITQNIREVMQRYPVSHIVMVGASMGACTSLVYAVLAPDDIRRKISGIVCIEGAGDLAKLYNETHAPLVQSALARCFGGPPSTRMDAYQSRSFIAHCHDLPKDIRIAAISGVKDRTVPPDLQEEVVDAVNQSGEGRQAKRFEFEEGHTNPPVELFREALQFASGDNGNGLSKEQ